MKNTTFFPLLFFIFIMPLFCKAQTNTESKEKQNAIFVEALGNGLIGSVNYEYMFTDKPGVSLRAGLGMSCIDDLYVTFPFSVQYFFKLKREQFIEAGVGYTYAKDMSSHPFENFPVEQFQRDLHNFFLSVGYRKHFGDDWMWKANFTPFINSNDVLLPWFGISFGKRF